MKPVTKPRAKVRKVFDWAECTAFIERKYKITVRDFARSHDQFGELCDVKGYKDKDPEGNDRGSSKIWFAEFQAEINAGKIEKRPYQDFWHWLISVSGVHVQRGGTIELDAEMSVGAELWQKQILDLYLKEFGKGPYLTQW